MLIPDLNYNGVNRLIHPDIIEKRLRCRQRCQLDFSCHYCHTALDLANPDLLKNALKK